MSKNGRGNNRNVRGQSGSPRANVFDHYMSTKDVEAGILNGTVLKGLLRVNPNNWKIAYVSCEGMTIDVCIDDVKLRNRAIHEDLVALQLLPKSEWLQIVSKAIVSHDSIDNNFEFPMSGNDNIIQKELWQAQNSLLVPELREATEAVCVSQLNSLLLELDEYCRNHQLQPRAKIVHILESNHKKVHNGSLIAGCQLREGQRLPESESSVSFRPTDKRYPNLHIQRMQLPTAYILNPLAQSSKIFCAEIQDPWSPTSNHPLGKNLRSVGEIGSIHDETAAILTSYGVDHAPHSDEMIQPLRDMLFQGASQSAQNNEEKVNWTIPESEIARRRDLRSYRIFTIDPYNAKDLDDALHITPRDDGNFEIGVHIADVSYFLREDTLLDIEARRRATSIYLVQKVIPMLPSILCEQLCSLNPNVDRLAFSCIYVMKPDGNLTEEPPYFGRTVIRSCAKLDYATAQRMIEGIIPSSPDLGPDADSFLSRMSEAIWEKNRRPIGHAAWECANDVCLMNSIAQERRVVRMSNGALVIRRPKMSFRLDDDGNPSAAADYPIRESNNLVEEYMLLANFLVAQEMLLRNGKSAFLRQHSPPDSDKLGQVKSSINRLGIKLDTSSSRGLHQSILAFSREGDSTINSAISQMLMATLNAARYIVAGDELSSNWAHYALGIPFYTHFTSPIRRYADVMVHRLLDLGLRDEEEARKDSKNPTRMKEYSKIAEKCNEMKFSSRKVQEASDELFLAVYLQDHHTYADAAVVGLGPKTFQVMVRCLGETFKLFVDEMSGIQYHFDEKAQELTLVADPRGQNGGQGQGQGESKRNNEKVLFTHPNILAFDKLTLSLAAPVVVYLTSRSEGHLTTRCSLVCAGTCASRGFLNANFESAATPSDLISNADDDDT